MTQPASEMGSFAGRRFNVRALGFVCFNGPSLHRGTPKHNPSWGFLTLAPPHTRRTSHQRPEVDEAVLLAEMISPHEFPS